MDVFNILFRQVRGMLADFIRLLPAMTIALLVIVATMVASKFARKLAERLLAKTDLRSTLINLVETLLGVMIWVLGLLIAMSIVLPGVTPANILAVLGLGSVAVGFAFKDIFENFLAGVLIMVRKKMRIGDVIECQDIQGRVTTIALRDTHVRLLSNELVILPNSFLFKNPVTILTEDRERRHQVEVGVGYGEDLDLARDVIMAAVAGAELVDEKKPIEVYAKEFGDSSIVFLVRWWGGSRPAEAHASRDSVVRSIKRALDEAGIELPFPYRTLTFKEPLRIAREHPSDGEPPAR